MNRFVLVLFVALSSACSSASSSTTGSETFPASPYSTFATDSGSYRVTMRTSPSQPPVRGDLQVELRVTNADGTPVDGLSIDAIPWMPSHGHGSSVTPSIDAEGDGVYRVDDVSMYMPGAWQLRLKVGSDVATPTIDVQ